MEEEYFLVHPRTGHLVRRVPARFLQACRKRFGHVVCPELLQSQIEVSSPVFSTAAEARDRMTELRLGVAEVADAFGYRLVAAGTHPLASWQNQEATAKARYASLIEDFQIIGRRNVLCALHVHCAVPDGVDRVALMNRLMPWLPLLLALSASSPFWCGLPTGLMSYRQAAYDEWPRTGIPDFFADQAEYDGFVDLLQRQGAIPDASYLWWAIRPALAWPTLELRICDSCTRLEDALALAAVYRCLVRAHLRQPELGVGHGPATRRTIDENRWRAKRFGTLASFIDDEGDRALSFAEAIDRLRTLIAEDVDALDCSREWARIERIVEHGTSAQAQIAVYQHARAANEGRLQATRSVVDWLAVTTLMPPGP